MSTGENEEMVKVEATLANGSAEDVDVEMPEADESEMKEEHIETKYPDKYVVKIRGIPYQSKASEISEFFGDDVVEGGGNGVHFLVRKNGMMSGEAYVQLKGAEAKAGALEKSGKYMGKRYLEVFSSTYEQMEWQLEHQPKARRDEANDCLVKLRGLPYGVSKEELMTFFSGLSVAPNGITILTNREGKMTGEAFVEFTNSDAAEQAVEKHMQNIQHRYIEVYKSNFEEMDRIARAHGHEQFGMMGPMRGRPGPYSRMPPPHMMRGRGYGFPPPWGMPPPRRFPPPGPRGMFYPPPRGYPGHPGQFGGRGAGPRGAGPPPPPSGHCVKMRGLPFKSKEEDIKKFFAPTAILGVRFHYNYNNQPSGDADVWFNTHDDAIESMNKDRAYMGQRYVELELHSEPRKSPMPAPGGSYNASYSGGYSGASFHSSGFGAQYTQF